ncbi:hypothetical protein PR048_019374 [Dryococelus australis]|uniref:Uncharacterized protein n=1 Tax=Dryococelus australis TaxID=614101 RepID=A0ABQ9H3C0_9NEOP|nr:hypothetical protein PR048_019374 [Dryococelus australis]
MLIPGPMGYNMFWLAGRSGGENRSVRSHASWAPPPPSPPLWAGCCDYSGGQWPVSRCHYHLYKAGSHCISGMMVLCCAASHRATVSISNIYWDLLIYFVCVLLPLPFHCLKSLDEVFRAPACSDINDLASELSSPASHIICCCGSKSAREARTRCEWTVQEDRKLFIYLHLTQTCCRGLKRILTLAHDALALHSTTCYNNMAVKQLLDQFYSLSGKTIAEKLKCLNHLISDLKLRCEQDEINQFIAEIKPKNAFEKLLKGRLIDSFRRSRELVEVLKCDDRLFIKQVLGCDWFFEGSSTDFPSCEFFMTNVFPSTSFSTRNDIIHMLSLHIKDSCMAEQLFEALRSQYGFQQARPLLCNCSAHFVQSVLDSNISEVHFTQREVSKLCKKHPVMVKCNVKKKYFACHISEILKVLIDVDVNIFIELFESKNCDVASINLKIGRRGTKKIVHTNPVGIIKSAVKYNRILNPRYLQKYLSAEDFSEFYISLFPESFEETEFFWDFSSFYTMVEMFPTNKRLEMLLSCFEKVYGESLLKQTDLVGEKLLKLLSPVQREKCVQQKIDKCLREDNDETQWLSYLTAENSVPMLNKYLIEAANTSDRSRLITCLILTCKINEDLEALASVCKHVVSRYCNDHFSLRFNFLNDLLINFDLVNLEDRHWSSVLELINMFFLNEEYQRNITVVADILVEAINYKLNRKADITKQIDQLIIVKLSMCSNINNWLILDKEPKYQVVIFEAFGERIPKVKKLKVPLSKVAFSLLKSVVTWNKKNKMFQFSLSKFTWAVENLRKITETNLQRRKKKTLLDLLTYDVETKQLLFPDYVCSNKRNKDVKYFLKMDIEQFIQNAEKEVQFLLDSWTGMYRQVFRTWNLQSFTKVKDTVVEICVRMVESDADIHKRENAIIVLSFLMQEGSFSKLIAPFCPVSEKIAVEDEETEKILPLCKKSAICLHNINPWNDFSTVTQFCKGDYLKFVLGSLTSICYKTSEKRVLPILERLAESPVSLKKHALRLTFDIVCKPQILPVLQKLWNCNQNPATREVLLRLVSRAFQRYPTHDMFILFKFYLSSVTADYKNAFNEMSIWRLIPDDYKGEYVELCWHKLHVLQEQGTKTKAIISDLANSLQSMVEYLPSGFCDHVLKQYLIKDSPFLNKCTNFAAAYLLHTKSQEELNMRFDVISNLLKDMASFGSSAWKDIENFINILCTEAMSEDGCVNIVAAKENVPNSDD